MILALAGLGELVGPGAAPLAAGPYQAGEHVQFTGIVSDAEGRPLAGVHVAVEASRSYFSLRELRRAEKDTRRVSAVTNGLGEYAIDWPWDGYYNRFEVVAGVPVRKGRQERLEVLERSSVTERVLAGSPVVSALVIKNRAFVDKLREFVASIASADERRVYEDMGTPDDVKRINYAGMPAHSEASWWYFDTGKVYRFRDGRLQQVDNFDPVRRF